MRIIKCALYYKPIFKKEKKLLRVRYVLEFIPKQKDSYQIKIFDSCLAFRIIKCALYYKPIFKKEKKLLRVRYVLEFIPKQKDSYQIKIFDSCLAFPLSVFRFEINGNLIENCSGISKFSYLCFVWHGVSCVITIISNYLIFVF